jgi:hypothetical protein
MKAFVTGFVIGLAGFSAVNVLAHYYYPYGAAEIRPLVQYYGFPFVVWTRSGLIQPLNGIALCADIGIAVVVGAVVGRFWKRYVGPNKRMQRTGR